MENIKILIDGIQKDVYGIFYIYDSKYYFIYTEKEVDENDYVVLYMTQIGRETMNTENGPVDTGYMIGMEITSPEEQQKVQTSVSYIVEDKKNNTVNPKIQYLPMSMLSNLKILSKKRFRLMKSIIVNNFKLQIDNPVTEVAQPVAEIAVEPIPTISQPVANIPVEPITAVSQPVANIPVEPITAVSQSATNVPVQQPTTTPLADSNVIIDYRSKYFEEEEKNKELQEQINELTKKLEEIKKVLE